MKTVLEIKNNDDKNSTNNNNTMSCKQMMMIHYYGEKTYSNGMEIININDH